LTDGTLRSPAELRLIGAGIVEVAPAYDHAQNTGIAAAHVGYELLSALAAGRPPDERGPVDTRRRGGTGRRIPHRLTWAAE
jgi:hypothetical protein